MKNKGIKRFISLLMTVALSVGIMGMSAFAAAQPKSDPDLCFVDTGGGNLNGRSGPGEEYSLVCKYANGTQVHWSVMPGESDYDTEGRLWTRVVGKTTTGTTKTAWVLDEYLRYESPYSVRIAPIINPNTPDVG